MKSKNIQLKFGEEASKEALSVRQLTEELNNEVENYNQLNSKEKLMNQKIVMQLTDDSGNVISGDLDMFISWVENGTVYLTGNVNYVYEQK
ncbi:hypothetical protein [Paraliobacillus ryukyuensis]|uniref:hypothetical protein n=1 Tax=Paraliobacillus ryukyuensis TaxID=200904 RepID=UPI0009A784CA|nr:hypothetical protein [Paraliobacillus ryukyuensis]